MEADNLANAEIDRSLKCGGCGALLHFKPGTNKLHCDYCGEGVSIAGNDDAKVISSYDFHEFLAGMGQAKQSDSLKAVHCDNCGSNTMLDRFVTSEKCPFCAAGLVLTPGGNQYLAPHYILPFEVTQAQSVAFFDKWLKGLWWAPNDLSKKVKGSASSLRGVYLPYWAFDTFAITDYTGERGDYYYTAETYTETVNGETQTRSRQARRTRWSYASGRTNRKFKDLLVPASKSLPYNTQEKLTPWAFNMLVRFDERYMSGFRSETYQVKPEDGFVLALKQTIDQIRADIRDDIGGDEQRIDNVDTDYTNRMIKYLMLPVWVSAYNYNNKVYQFTVNASTGEVIGQRPISAWKIFFAIVGILILIGVIVILCQG